MVLADRIMESIGRSPRFDFDKRFVCVCPCPSRKTRSSNERSASLLCHLAAVCWQRHWRVLLLAAAVHRTLRARLRGLLVLDLRIWRFGAVLGRFGFGRRETSQGLSMVGERALSKRQGYRRRRQDGCGCGCGC